MAIGETINHYGIVRLRVRGSGSLKMKLMGPPDENDVQEEVDLIPVTLPFAHPITNSLANFKSISAQLRIEVTEIDETFIIDKILVYVIPVEVNYPQ